MQNTTHTIADARSSSAAGHQSSAHINQLTRLQYTRPKNRVKKRKIRHDLGQQIGPFLLALVVQTLALVFHIGPFRTVLGHFPYIVRCHLQRSADCAGTYLNLHSPWTDPAISPPPVHCHRRGYVSARCLAHGKRLRSRETWPHSPLDLGSGLCPGDTVFWWKKAVSWLPPREWHWGRNLFR